MTSAHRSRTGDSTTQHLDALEPARRRIVGDPEVTLHLDHASHSPSPENERFPNAFKALEMRGHSWIGSQSGLRTAHCPSAMGVILFSSANDLFHHRVGEGTLDANEWLSWSCFRRDNDILP